jgi:glucans biosynthesis protein
MSDYPMHRAARCGAKTRKGTPCQAPAIRGKARCRMHGGKSPGRPPIHGRYSKATVERRRAWRRALRDLERIMGEVVESRKAGYQR